MHNEQELPEGWIVAKLGDVTFPTGTRDPQLNTEDYFYYVDIEAVDNTKQKIVAPKRLSVREAPSRARMAIQMNDIIFSLVRPYLKNIAIIPEELDGQIASTAFCAIRPENGVMSTFIYYTLLQQSFIDSIKTYGNNPPAAHDNEFLAIDIPIAPTKEQQRIVSVLEEQFTRLDDAIASLRQDKAHLKQARASVLKAAVEGTLTEVWRATHPDVEPAEKLLERILIERREKWMADLRAKGKDPTKVKYVEPVEPDTERLPELPGGWCWTTVGLVTECLDSKRVPVNKEERIKRVGTIPYYGANGQVGWIDKYIFDEPLILVVEDETFIGRVVPFSYKITGKTWVNNHAHVLRPTFVVHIDYLNYSLSYYPFTPMTQGTTGRRKLTQNALLLAPYALPPFAEQQQIVSEVEQRLSVIAQAEIVVETSLKRAERTRQSILQKAFSGQLVSQDPNDEPASVLLERIREEREQREQGRINKKQRMRTANVPHLSEPETIDAKEMQQEELWQEVNS